MKRQRNPNSFQSLKPPHSRNPVWKKNSLFHSFGKKKQGRSQAIRWKWIFFIFSCLSTTVLGISWGEEFIAPTWGAALGGLGFIGLYSVGRFLGKLVPHWFFVLVLPLALFISWGGATLDVQQAVSECQLKSDQLREDLARFKNKNGWYPVSLDQLGWAHLPGNRLIGESVLHYDFGPVSYQLYFSARRRGGVWKSCSGIRKK